MTATADAALLARLRRQWRRRAVRQLDRCVIGVHCCPDHVLVAVGGCFTMTPAEIAVAHGLPPEFFGRSKVGEWTAGASAVATTR
jgi:hypothetical protein